jgi:Tfp pilus assembly protein FimT
MLEMMIVVVLVGIMATIAVPTFVRTIPRLKARAEARNALNLIRTARSRSISENTQYGVYFNINGRTYILFKDTVNPSSATYDVGDSLLGSPIHVDPNVVYTSCTLTGNCVVFLASGAASQSGTITLNTTDGSQAYSISVLAATGKTKLQ